MSSPSPEVSIHTDGSSRGNPGPGGYAAVLAGGGRRKEIAGGFRRTTNNRMELMAAIAGLEALRRPCRVRLHSDSRYLVDAVTRGWLRSWRGRGWRKADGGPVRNVDLWRRLEDASRDHDITWIWVRGHAGEAGNERCDRLATRAAEAAGLPPDPGFEEA